MRHWRKLPPKEFMDAPSLEIFYASWDWGSGQHDLLEGVLAHSRRLGTVFKDSSNPDHSVMLSWFYDCTFIGNV